MSDAKYASQETGCWDAGCQGPVATSSDDLKRYTGLAGENAVVGELRRAACRAACNSMGAQYSGTVEFQLYEKIVILCAQTADFLYASFTPTTTTYDKGSHPDLERSVEDAVRGFDRDQDKALALMRLCRDLYKTRTSDTCYFYGGTEEELIEKGESLCECLGRLYVALCEVAGIPGRIVTHVIAGHTTAEVYIEGGWAYVDPRCGTYFFKTNGRFASVLDLLRNRDIIRVQTDQVKADVSDRWDWDFRAWKCENLYFHPENVNAFVNYSLCDASTYNYPRINKEEADARMDKASKRYNALLRQVFGLADDVKL